MKLLEDRPLTTFAIVCFIWGTTWWAAKVAIADVPPLFMAGTRFAVAGAIMTALGWRHGNRPQAADIGRFLLSALVMIALSYGALFWGMQYIESGLSAVVEMSLTPLALLICGVAFGEEHLTARKVLALLLGIAGVVLMFVPDLMRQASSHDDSGMRLLGGLAVASSAFTYGLGSVLARPLLKTYTPTLISGITTLAGGLALFAASLAFEPEALRALKLDWGWPAWLGWLYLTVFGSLVAFVLYMRLLRDLGPSRSGNFAFVSPAIAVLTGAIALGERVPVITWLGMAVMLSAAFLSLHGEAGGGKT